MKVSLFSLPYHLARPRIGMGGGPIRYLDKGADQLLREHGCEVDVETIEHRGPFQHEIATIIELNAQLAEGVRKAVQQHCFPLVLAGNCNTCLGTLAGLGSTDVGIIWFDAHGDFNTPETTRSGFLDGMALAIATGQCWKQLACEIPDFRPIPETRTLLVGVRDLDPEEKELLERTQVVRVGADRIRRSGLGAALEPALHALASRVREIYLHIDIDVLDPSEAPANEYSAPGGLSLAEVEQAVGLITERFLVRAAALTAYNPDYDPENKTLQAGLRLMSAIIKAASASAAKLRPGCTQLGGPSPL
jgi:arginase